MWRAGWMRGPISSRPDRPISREPGLTHTTRQPTHRTGHLTWRGSDAKAKPNALLAQQDGVPAAPGTEALWTKLPFCRPD